MGNLVSNQKMLGRITEVKELVNSIYVLEREAAKKSKEFLIKALSLNGGKIEFHTYDEDGYQTDDNSFCVPYDGGNHPEYASNCFSNVESVFMEDKDIFLEIEDCDEYPLENIDGRVLCEMCLFINENLF